MYAKGRLLFLYLKTGGGHLAPAKALADWISQNSQNDADVILHDGFEKVNPCVKWIVEDGYRHSQAKGKWMFELIYAVNKIKLFAHLSSSLISRFVLSALEKTILEEKPSKIIIFHFFLIKPVKELLRRNGLEIPVLTVVTDPFTAHPIWFLEKGQHFIVFSDHLKEYLERVENIESSRISVFPFVLSPKFNISFDSEKGSALREQLGIGLSSKVILMLGGADGIPRGEKLLKSFAKSYLDVDVVVVCGRNKSLFDKAQAIKLKYNFKRLHVLGFVDFVYELLGISELVVTKCGASTFSEVLLSGKVPLVNSYIWEQEKGNIEFITRNGLGIYEPSTKRIISLAAELVKDESFYHSFRQNISGMQLTNGTPLVSNFILQY